MVAENPVGRPDGLVDPKNDDQGPLLVVRAAEGISFDWAPGRVAMKSTGVRIARIIAIRARAMAGRARREFPREATPRIAPMNPKMKPTMSRKNPVSAIAPVLL
jgi:hypothetical protein